MLDYDCGIGDEGPEVVRLELRIALKVLEECLLIGVIVWICCALAIISLSIGVETHKTASPITASSMSPFSFGWTSDAHLCVSLVCAVLNCPHWSCEAHYVFCWWRWAASGEATLDKWHLQAQEEFGLARRYGSWMTGVPC